jgi:multidrug resistance efflux pump
MSTRRRPARLVGYLGLIVLAAGLAGAGWVFSHSRAGDPAVPTAAAPERGVACFGHVDVEHGVTALYPAQPGRVAEVLVRETAAVEAGTVLLRLDDRLARYRVEEARADLQAARAQLTQARTLPEKHRLLVAQQQAAVEAVRHRLAAAREQLAHKEALVRREQTSAVVARAGAEQVRELEAAERAELAKLSELDLHLPAVAVERAEAEVAAKKANLDKAEYALEECTLKAPVAGTVLRVFVGPGDLLGGQPSKPAIQFCPDRPRIVRAEVEQEFVARVSVGQTATLQDEGSTGQTWRGKVARVSDWITQRRSVLLEPFQVNDVRTLECIIELDPGQPQPRIGQRLRVTIGQLPS